jgi:hypothetical protein
VALAQMQRGDPGCPSPLREPVQAIASLGALTLRMALPRALDHVQGHRR